jgi:DNA-binding NarL/FixJ family response regulator
MRQNISGSTSLPLIASEHSITANQKTRSPSSEPLATAGEKQAVRLALIDPKPLTRQSILQTLTKKFPEYMVVAAASCEELLELTGKTADHSDLVLIHTRSAQLTDSWVQHTLGLLSLQLSGASVVLLSDRDDAEEVLKALTYGVRGYIPTSVGAEVAFAALRLINAGGIFIPAHALVPAAVKAETGPEGRASGLPGEAALTPRELAVVALLREGKPNKRIAAELHMQESTVKVHVRNILKKLHVSNRTHAAFVANRMLGQSARGGLPRDSSDPGSSH